MTNKNEQDISPEDQEVILALNILREIIGGLMKTVAEAVAEIGLVRDSQNAQNVKLATYFTEVLNAVNRLEAKVVAAADAQSVVDALAPIKQSFVDQVAALDVKIAEAQITGV